MDRAITLRLLSLAIFLFFFALLGPADASVITFGSGSNQFDMTFVEIGNPANADDTTGKPNPAGSVAYKYQIGKYEVREEMIDKFNSSQSLNIYSKDTRGANKPATSVSWNHAARFVNWLNTSQGHQAAYNFTTDGVDDNIALWTSEEAWQLGGENLFRHKDAHYFLCTLTTPRSGISLRQVECIDSKWITPDRILKLGSVMDLRRMIPLLGFAGLEPPSLPRGLKPAVPERLF